MHFNFTRILAMVFAFTSLEYFAHAKDQFTISSPETRINLLEMYSSEGCSSCPAAEKWIGKLTDHPGLWKNFIPIVFHVSYWDNSEHKDPFANSEFNLRQKQYGKEWKKLSTYTPGFILNGTEWDYNRDFKNVETVKEKDQESPGKLIAMQVSKNKKSTQFKIIFQPNAGRPKAEFLYAAVLCNGITHKIQRGENAGSTLTHNFVVIDWQQRPTDANQEAVLNLKTESSHKCQTQAVVFWASTSSSQKPLQSVAAPFN
jgi:hypothetical protein